MTFVNKLLAKVLALSLCLTGVVVEEITCNTDDVLGVVEEIAYIAGTVGHSHDYSCGGCGDDCDDCDDWDCDDCGWGFDFWYW